MAGDETVLDEAALAWEPGSVVRLRLVAEGHKLTGMVDARIVLRGEVNAQDGGAVALVCEEGRLDTEEVRVRALGRVFLPA